MLKFSLSYASIIYVCFAVVWATPDLQVPCEGEYNPENCDNLNDLRRVEDFERCALGLLPPLARNYYWSADGRRLTFKENYDAYRRIRIIPKILRDVSSNSLTTSVLGQKISFPVGISPTALHKLATPEGEVATARATSAMGNVMILSSFSSTLLEDVARAAPKALRWMQVYIFKNRSMTVDIVKRAEKAGYRAIVVTVGAPTHGMTECNTDSVRTSGTPNINNQWENVEDLSVTFMDITWLRYLTELPIVAKGILTGESAVQAAEAGADAILVSNQGGRQLDSAPATIDVLPEVVAALKKYSPNTEVYVDGGVRDGTDVFKALALGARAAFIGRPVLWGLAIRGEHGVINVLEILKRQFNETMILSGNSCPDKIDAENLHRTCNYYQCL